MLHIAMRFPKRLKWNVQSMLPLEAHHLCGFVSWCSCSSSSESPLSSQVTCSCLVLQFLGLQPSHSMLALGVHQKSNKLTKYDHHRNFDGRMAFQRVRPCPIQMLNLWLRVAKQLQKTEGCGQWKQDWAQYLCVCAHNVQAFPAP